MPNKKKCFLNAKYQSIGPTYITCRFVQIL